MDDFTPMSFNEGYEELKLMQKNEFENPN